MHYFRRSRSGQVHSFMAARTCLRSVETNLTLTCPSPKSFVCSLPVSGRHVTSVFQGLSLSVRRAGRGEPWERSCNYAREIHVKHYLPVLEIGKLTKFCRNSAKTAHVFVRLKKYISKQQFLLFDMHF